jgi:hypothetical protein
LIVRGVIAIEAAAKFTKLQSFAADVITDGSVSELRWRGYPLEDDR